MRMISALFGTAMLVSVGVGQGFAQQTLTFGHIGAPGSLFDVSANEFARIANERLGDDYAIEVFGASQLGNDSEILQKLKLGQVHFGLPSSIMSSIADEFGIFEMPYVIQSREHMQAVEGAILDKVLQPAVQEQGYRILAVWENGFRQITNNVRPIETPADLQGVKLRTPRGEWRVKMFQTYGANPTPMAFSEVFTALQTGVIDGQENPYAQIATAKFQEVQEFLSVTNHVYTPAYIIVSERHFSRLPEDVQTALTEAARETQAFVYEEAARLDTVLLAEIEAAGVAVNEADTASFIEASGGIYDAFATSFDGADALIAEVQALAPTN